MTTVTVVLMVETVLMMIPMMLGMTAMTVAAIPPPGGKFPGSFLPAGALLLSVWFPPCGGGEKIIRRSPPMILGQRVVVCQRGAGEGPQGPGAGPTRAPRWARGRGSPLPPVARLFAPLLAP